MSNIDDNAHIYKRYSKQMLLAPIGRQSQYELTKARILIVGAGGLAATCVSYLVGAGIGYIRIVDHDLIEESNLHRQIMFTTDDIGKSKAECIVDRARLMNPHVKCDAICAKFSYENAYSILTNTIADVRLSDSNYVQHSTQVNHHANTINNQSDNNDSAHVDIDLIVDCTDNIHARYCMSDVCCLYDLLLVSGSAIGFEGQVTVLGSSCGAASSQRNPIRASGIGREAFGSGGRDEERHSYVLSGPCYRCMYPTPSVVEGCRSCASSGVLGPLPGIIGSFQAVEVIKCLIRLHSRDRPEDCHGRIALQDRLLPLSGRQLWYDGLTGETNVYDISDMKNPDCISCGKNSREKNHHLSTIEECGRYYQNQMHGNAKPVVSNVGAIAPEVIENDIHIDIHSYYPYWAAVCEEKNYQSNLTDRPTCHVLLDVREVKQFEMLSLLHYFEIDGYTGATDGMKKVSREVSVDISWDEILQTKVYAMTNMTNQNKFIYVNMPLANFMGLEMQSDRNAEDSSTIKFKQRKIKFEKSLALFIQLLTYCTNEVIELPKPTGVTPYPLYVLCRRGVDSLTTTKLFRTFLAQSAALPSDSGNISEVIAVAQDVCIRNVQYGLIAWRNEIDPRFPDY